MKLINKVYKFLIDNVDIILSAVVFLYTITTLIRFNTAFYGTLYLESPDGTLYLSIAENFLDNGHFIQKARPWEINMVVPFGTPLLYTILLLIFQNFYTIIAIQYLLYGIAVTILAVAVKKLAGSYWAYIIVPKIFISFRDFIKEPNPGYLLTETYTIFFLCLFIYLLIANQYSEKRIIALYICAFSGYCFRPVTGVIILIPLLLAIWDIIKSFRNRKKRRCKILKYMLPVLFSAVILIANGMINYKETGRFVLIENYGGVPAYQANNINTKTTAYSSNLAKDFSDEYFFEIYENSNLDMNEKNELLNARTSEFIRGNLEFVLHNAVIRYRQFYHMPEHGFNLILFFLCVLFLALFSGYRKGVWVLISMAFLGATIVPAFGLYIPRYGIPCIPFYSLAYGASLSIMISFLLRLIRKGLCRLWK